MRPGDERFEIDPANPGQFFAACGLLEMADRLWGGVEGWFDGTDFVLGHTGVTTPSGSLVETLAAGSLSWVRPADTLHDDEGELAWPLQFSVGEQQIVLDWWRDTRAGGSALKVWAGSMHAGRIAAAMLAALRGEQFHGPGAFNVGIVVPDPDDPRKKKEPFYFDARRGDHATARDVGFSADAVGVDTVAYPAVELLCVIGLQRFRPVPDARSPRAFTYFTWNTPLAPAVAAVAVQGHLAHVGGSCFRFENRFRTGQRKHKAFGPASPLQGDEHGRR